MGSNQVTGSPQSGHGRERGFDCVSSMPALSAITEDDDSYSNRALREVRSRRLPHYVLPLTRGPVCMLCNPAKNNCCRPNFHARESACDQTVNAGQTSGLGHAAKVWQSARPRCCSRRQRCSEALSHLCATLPAPPGAGTTPSSRHRLWWRRGDRRSSPVCRRVAAASATRRIR